MFCERIDNDALRLLEVVSAAGEGAEVVIEATYGWYWAVDLLREAGFSVHLAHPSGNDWGKRRVKNDERDARDLADCCVSVAWRRRGSHRRRCARRASWSAIERGWCSCAVGLKAQVHAVMAKEGVLPGVTDMFGPKGQSLLDAMELADAYQVRVESLRDLIEVYDREVGMLERRIHELLRDDRGYQAIQALDGVGRTIGAIFVTEIGDISRFRSPEALCSWAGLDAHGIGSPTPRSCAARSPNKARSWCVGRRWKRSSATTAAHRCVTGSIASRNDAAPTKRASRPPAGS